MKKIILFSLLVLSGCGGSGGSGGDDNSGNYDPEYIWVNSPTPYDSTYNTDRPSIDMSGGSYISSSTRCPSLLGGTISPDYSVTWSNSANNASGSAHVGVGCFLFVVVYWEIYNIPLELGENIITLSVVDPVDGISGAGIFTVYRLPDTTAPKVSTTSPADGRTDQSVYRTISIRFNEAMDASSLNTSTYIVKDQNQNSINGTVSYYHNHYSYDAYTAIFTPDEPLIYSTSYTATITTGAKDLYGGNSLPADYGWSFTTEANPDVTPPAILNTSPSQNSYCAGVNNPITVTFDEGIDSTTLNSNSFYLQDDLGNLVNANISYEEPRAILLPLTNLNYNSAYTATVTQAIADYAGNTLTSDYFVDFSTVMNEGAGNWVSTTLDGAPVELNTPVAIWTGDRVIIWGLEISYDWSWGSWNYISIARAYDPITDSWSGLSDINIPSPRLDATVIWTGSEMIVWGGYLFGKERGDGAAYNPSTDTWRTISNVGAPSARRFHNAVWTGNEMIIWGGSRGSTPLSDGARYKPATNSWTPISTVSAPVNEEVYDSYSTMVWTGTEAILWSHYRPGQSSRYNPTSDTWTQVNTTNAPKYLIDHVAVWTGNEMIIWGSPYNDSPAGSRYNPVTDSWTSMSDSCGLEPRRDMKAIWTGNEMIIWGGTINNGGIYTPATDSWEMMNITNAPSQRSDQAMVWTGSEGIVWGGLNSDNSRLNTGGRFFL